MIKHVGKHNTQRVVIAYRQIPDEDHMCLVIYSEALPMRLHDEVMRVLESAAGQDAKELSDALFRHTMADGVNCLTALHKGGLLKKVPTNQVIVTPTAKSSVRLDELNKILNEMAQGEEAIKKLAGLDAKPGFDGSRELGEPAKTTSASVSGDVLSDADIASQRIAQANKLRADAQGLLAEATRLEGEANALAPKVTKAKVTKAKATTVTTTPAKKPNARKPATKKAAA
jgi:outer membrane murein-binding lipoprotein Lpp